MRRRQFIKKTAGAAAAMSLALPREPAFSERRRLKYLGWQVGLTYQTREPRGLDRDYIVRLLDEMSDNGMNLLSLMMLSYGYYDPNHDGYCWPVQNPKLKHYWDSTCINGGESTEFVREIIEAAAARGIEIQLMMNWGIWNTEKIRMGYPSASPQRSRTGTSHPCLHCPDSEGAWLAGLDEVEDLLTYYNHPNVTSYAFERISYADRRYCYCRSTEDVYERETGSSIRKADGMQLEEWKKRHISACIKRYVSHIKAIRPNIAVCLHTQCAKGWGHDPARLPDCGVDFVQPHTIHFQESKEQIHAKLRYLAPNSCVLHFCARDRRPANYNLWIKTPDVIAQALDWVYEYPGNNLEGILFFNETACSPRNKQAVYELIKRFR